MKAPRGFILYQGPSLLDGSPIVAIALTHSSNRKTGDMVQTYIIRSDVDPVTAARQGDDAAVCGDCKHRPINGGACYVTLIHGPSSVYRAYKRGAYPLITQTSADDPTHAAVLASLGAGRMVRLGTYGDPAAVPARVWQALVSEAQGRTGYTHQWLRSFDAREGANEALSANVRALRALVMASVDTADELELAQALHWRTFRIRGALSEPLQRGEFVCPASEEASKVKTCATCGACDGAQRGTSKANPVIVVHGSKARRFSDAAQRVIVPIVPV